ncbi:MAG: amino acid synthesis family protein [Nitrospinota bacterium]
MGMKVRKFVTLLEETRREGGRDIRPPIRKAAAIAVFENPFAGRYEEDLEGLISIGEEAGGALGRMAVQMLGEKSVHSYGKGAIVGTAGELEHAAAILHPKLGKPLRELVGGGKAVIASSKKRAAAGTSIDVPLHYKDAVFVRSHYDAMTVSVPDAPFPDEILCAIVLTDGGRPLPRVGGLKLEEVKGEDGLR